MSEGSSTREERLLRQVSRLGREHALFEPGDRIMVACSGGKDSWAMLHLLRAHVRRLPFPVSLVAMNLDQGQPGYDPAPLREHLRAHGFEFHLERQDTYAVVVDKTPPGKTYCSRCSRMRRAVLHRVADRLGANKISLGHHRDDLIETLLLNQLFAGRLRAMAAKLPAPPEGGHAIIRPLLGCAEAELAAYAADKAVPILPCNLCGSQPDARRQQVKRWLAALEAQIPDLRQSLAAAAGNVEPGHLLDRRLLGPEEDTASTSTHGSLVQLRSRRMGDFAR
ncbi:MAG: tRNA 2-thiocytidine(32) synthetase TtcA [Myxococcales bacterium]|nr:tRNA 2-thiocytidine(32) synthetase TtcA [Myxococcales bacterium]